MGSVSSSQYSRHPTGKAVAAASLRFFTAVAVSLICSVFFDNYLIGGYAALSAFMLLICDLRTDLPERLQGLLIAAFSIAAAECLGNVLFLHPYGKWLVLILSGFGASLLSFAEKYWWLIGKMSLVCFMTSLFTYRPEVSAVAGFVLGGVLAALCIVADARLWKTEALGERPMDQILKILGGDRNPIGYAAVSALCLTAALLTAEIFGLHEIGWIGLSFVYLMNTKISVGFRRISERVAGTFLGYLFCMKIYAVSEHLLILAAMLCIVAALLPYFIVKSYLVTNFLITTFILLMLHWMLSAAGGDRQILEWRFWDTVYGAAWAMIGMTICALPTVVKRFQGFLTSKFVQVVSKILKKIQRVCGRG